MQRASLLPFALLSLAACEGGGDPVDQALREESASNHAEAAFAREAQAEGRAARAAERQAEIDRLHREITVAEVALEASDDPEIQAAAQRGLDENRRSLAALDADR